MNDVQTLLRQVEKAGLRVTRGAKHYKIWTPEGVVGCPCSPSDYRSLRDVRSKLKRKGVVL
jgi:hypothetical protein